MLISHNIIHSHMVGLFTPEPPSERQSELKRKSESIIEEVKNSEKYGETILFKNERIAILCSQMGLLPEFIVAFDDLTKNGYRLMLKDKDTDHGGTYTGSAARYYFQKFAD